MVLLLVPGILAYQHFQEKIPNGGRVPHPCKVNYVWQGVGHMNKNGGGMRNKFGDDFARNGHVCISGESKRENKYDWTC